MSGGKMRGQDKYMMLVLAAAAVYAAIFSMICVLKYRSFSYHDFDLALNIQKYWNIIHADGRMSLIGDVNIWGNSLEVIAYPLGALYFLLFSSPEALLVLQTLAIAFAAVPLFLISKMHLQEKTAACISASYLLNPAVWYINLSEYHDVVFCILTLSFAFYFMKKGRFILFMLFVLFSISCRIDVAVVTAMFGIYALIDRKTLKWAAWPLFISAIWLAAGILKILPSAGGELRYEVYYSHLGSSFPEVAKNLLSDPSTALKYLFTGENAVFLAQLLFPVGFMPVLGLKELSICVFSFFQHAVSLRPEEHMIRYHYAVTLIPFIYISYAYGLRKVTNKIKAATLLAFIICLPVVANWFYGPANDIKGIAEDSANTELNASKEKLIREIPGDAAAIGTFEFLSHMANRKKLYSFHYIVRGPSAESPLKAWRPAESPEYAIIDFNDKTMPYFMNKDSDLRIRSFLEDGKYGVMGTLDTVVLFKKGHTGGPKLFESGIKAPSNAEPLARVGDKIALIKYDMNRTGRYIEMSFLWECLEPVEDDVWFLFQLMDKGGNEVYSTVKPACYGIYPMRRWVKGETVMDNFRMFVPVKVTPDKEYDVRMTLFLGGSMRALMIYKAREADINDRLGLLLGSVRF